MAFKMTKAESERMSKLALKLDDAKSSVEGAVEAYNLAAAELLAPVRSAIEEYNELLEEVRGFVADIADEQQSNYDGMSDKWQEGDKAQAVQSWIEEIEGAELDDIALEEPEDLDAPDMEHAEIIGALPPEPNE